MIYFKFLVARKQESVGMVNQETTVLSITDKIYEAF